MDGMILSRKYVTAEMKFLKMKKRHNQAFPEGGEGGSAIGFKAETDEVARDRAFTLKRNLIRLVPRHLPRSRGRL